MFTASRICIFSRRTTTSMIAMPGKKAELWEDLGTIHRTNDQEKDLYLSDNYMIVGYVKVGEVLGMIPMHLKNDFIEDVKIDGEYFPNDRIYVLSRNGNAIDASKFKSFKKLDEPFFSDLWVDGTYAILFGV